MGHLGTLLLGQGGFVVHEGHTHAGFLVQDRQRVMSFAAAEVDKSLNPGEIDLLAELGASCAGRCSHGSRPHVIDQRTHRCGRIGRSQTFGCD